MQQPQALVRVTHTALAFAPVVHFCGAGISANAAAALSVTQSSSLCDTEELACIISLSSTAFVNNTDIGAVWIGGKKFHLSIEDSNFTKSFSGLNGGAIEFFSFPGPDTWQLTANISASRFSGNQATGFGGAMRFTNANPSRPFAFNVNSSTFISNKGGKQGGALAVRQSNVSISDSSFFGNSAVNNDSVGGALGFDALCNSPILKDRNYFANHTFQSSIFGCSLNIISTNFSQNIADVSGGAIYASFDGFVTLIAKSRFDSNHLSGSLPSADADSSLVVRNKGGGTAVGLYPYTLGVGLSRLLLVSQTTFANDSGASVVLPQAALATQQLACLAIQDSLFHSNSAASASAVYSSDVEGSEELCYANTQTFTTMPALELHGPSLSDPFTTATNLIAIDSQTYSVPSFLTVDIRRTAFTNNTAFSSSAGQPLCYLPGLPHTCCFLFLYILHDPTPNQVC